MSVTVLRACWRAFARLGARSKVGVRFGVRDDTLLWKNPNAEALGFGAGGRTRTDTAFYGPRILSPVRLPFRHTGGGMRQFNRIASSLPLKPSEARLRRDSYIDREYRRGLIEPQTKFIHLRTKVR